MWGNWDTESQLPKSNIGEVKSSLAFDTLYYIQNLQFGLLGNWEWINC